MQANVTFEQIMTRLSCETTLPQIPLAAMRLCELVDQELISQDVLKVAASDPALTAGLLRSASSPLYALSPKAVTDVRAALSILGVRGSKSVAMSVLMQSVIGGSRRSVLDPQKFVQHSTFVGIMAKYVFLRHRQIRPFPTQVSGDEVFAAGILHDLGLGLLAVSYPEIYNDCLSEATARGIQTQIVFKEWFNEPITKLTLGAFQAWKLPPVFASLISCVDSPSSHASETIACASLAYSNWIADMAGFSERSEAPVYELANEVQILAGLPAEELPGAVQQVISHTESCVLRPKAA